MIADVLDDFVRDITERACKLAKHRKSDTVEIKDAHLALGRTLKLLFIIGFIDWVEPSQT